jgi:hypothetical protein
MTDPVNMSPRNASFRIPESAGPTQPVPIGVMSQRPATTRMTQQRALSPVGKGKNKRNISNFSFCDCDTESTPIASSDAGENPLAGEADRSETPPRSAEHQCDSASTSPPSPPSNASGKAQDILRLIQEVNDLRAESEMIMRVIEKCDNSDERAKAIATQWRALGRGALQSTGI